MFKQKYDKINDANSWNEFTPRLTGLYDQARGMNRTYDKNTRRALERLIAENF